MLSFWWSALLPLLSLAEGSSGEEKAEEVIGALGESVTFQLKVSKPFTTITWQRTNGLVNVVFLSLKEECEPIMTYPNYKGRLNVSKDCKRLQLKNVHQDDSGRYRAQILLNDTNDLLDEFFDLRVYKRLSEDDLSIRCNGIGNGTWRLNCSAKQWEDGVEFGMATSRNQRGVSGRSFDVRQDLEDEKEDNLGITCKATNPVSHASRTETVKDICDATGSTAGPALQNEKGPPLTAIIIIVVLLCVVSVCCAVLWYFRKKRKGDSRHLQGSADSGRCNTIYAQVGDVVEDRDSHQSHPRTQPAKEKPKTAQTVYITVDHACKPNPLQTDDEKMQKGRRRAAEPKEKTIYSEISTKPQENEDRSLKTVYETVNNPKPPKEQEYNKVI